MSHSINKWCNHRTLSASKLSLYSSVIAWQEYKESWWNIWDFVVVIGSYIDIIAEQQREVSYMDWRSKRHGVHMSTSIVLCLEHSCCKLTFEISVLFFIIYSIHISCGTFCKFVCLLSCFHFSFCSTLFKLKSDLLFQVFFCLKVCIQVEICFQ